MIENSKIISGLQKILKPYTPDKISTRLPTTMRELLDKCVMNAGEYLEIRIEEEFSGLYQTSQLPVVLSRRKYTRPAEIVDYSVFGQFTAVFYGWLKKHNQHRQIDLAHPLANRPWPIMKLFQKELKKRTGYDIDELFSPYDEGGDEGLAYYWLPLYWINDDSDDVPLIAMLESVRCYFQNSDIFEADDLPEAAAEIAGEKTDDVAEVFQGILEKERFKLLNKNWNRALTSLKNYKGTSLSYYESENMVEISEPDDFDNLFDWGRMVRDVIEAIDPLICELGTEPEIFWKNFIERIYGIEKKYPQIKAKRKQTKTTCGD